MKTKELKNLAKKIAKYELICQLSSDEDEIDKAQVQIMNLSSQVRSLEEIMIVDELVQDILEKELKEEEEDLNA